MTRLRAVTRWVRTGRPLTAQGRLLLPDARALAEALDVDAFCRDHARSADDLPDVSLLIAWARQARLLRVIKGRMVPVRSGAALLNRPIELWHRAFAALGELGEHLGGSNVFGAPSLFGMSLGEAFPLLLLELYSAGGAPVPVERFLRRVRDAINERFGCVVDDLAGDVEQRLWRRDVAAVIDALELLGAITLGESHEHDELTELAGRDDPDPTLVSLTPIGLWAVRELLLEQGVPAPLVGELAAEDVEYVCVRLAGVRMRVAEAELTAWVRARSVRAAADELARLLRRTDKPAHRALALYALRRTPSDATGVRRDGERREHPCPLPPGRSPRTWPLPVRAAGGRAQRSTEIGSVAKRAPTRALPRPRAREIAATLPELWRGRSGRTRKIVDLTTGDGQEPSAAATTSVASSWIRARCSGPLKLSA